VNAARRHEYLQAMGIDIWIPRNRPANDAANKVAAPSLTETDGHAACAVRQASVSPWAGGIVIGPGNGDTLLVCAKSEETATPLAADIARSLACDPVWAWPAPDGASAATSVSQALEERLFSRVLIFGHGLAPAIADSAAVAAGRAQLIRAEALPVLLESGEARRALWLDLIADHWCAEQV